LKLLFIIHQHSLYDGSVNILAEQARRKTEMGEQKREVDGLGEAENLPFLTDLMLHAGRK
jgi:hypothetical protein